MRALPFYKLIISFFILIFFLSCDNYSPEEREFLNKVNQIRKSYREFKGNDIAQDNECKKLDEYVQGFECRDWVGKVENVNSILGSRWIVLSVDKISIKIWPENDSKWVEIGEDILGNLKQGDKVKFSGKVIREMSITCFGKMDEPEIKIEPTSLSMK